MYVLSECDASTTHSFATSLLPTHLVLQAAQRSLNGVIAGPSRTGRGPSFPTLSGSGRAVQPFFLWVRGTRALPLLVFSFE